MEKRKATLSADDIGNLQEVAAYINNQATPMERPCRIAFMDCTKLKNAFREHYGCKITNGAGPPPLVEYGITHRRDCGSLGMDGESFEKQHHKAAGLLPREFRRMSSGMCRV